MALPALAYPAIGAGLNFISGLFQKRPKSFLDTKEGREIFERLKKLSTDPGAAAEIEQLFKPAQENVRRQILALGPPGASGAVSGALAGLEGQKAAATSELKRSSLDRLASLYPSFAGGGAYPGPEQTPDFSQLAMFLPFLLNKNKGVPGEINPDTLEELFGLKLPDFGKPRYTLPGMK